MSSGPEETTTRTTTELSPEQRALIEPVIPVAEQYLSAPAKLPDYSQIAPFNPTQLAAQAGLLGATIPQGQLAGQAAGATEFLLDDVLDPSSNESLQGYIEASTRPITEELMRTILPGIRNEAVDTGQYGGSRQGIAEGLAIQGATNAIADTTATIGSEAYGQGLDALTKGLALVPTTQAAQSAPAVTQGAVGDIRRAMQQEVLGEKAYRDIYSQIAPFLAAQEVAAIGSALPGGTAISSVAQPGVDPFQQALSIGLGGLAIGGSLFGVPPQLSAPAMAAVFGGTGGLY